MNYSEHFEGIKSILPNLDLLKEEEFYNFKNKDFAIQSINSSLRLCNNISNKLAINIYFGIKYDLTFNAKAIFKNQTGVILLNLGLIEKLESIVDDSIEVFSNEIIAKITISEIEKIDLKVLIKELALEYVFHHELAHIFQMFNSESIENYHFQEEYSETSQFNIKNHIYELDADLFGFSSCIPKLLEYKGRVSKTSNPVMLLNSLPILIFSISNIIILFSNNIKNIYYKKFSHPHPIIRILECSEQLLFLAFSNLKNQKKVVFELALQRVVTMIDQIEYFNKGQINYSNLVQENFNEIEKYINEIEIINKDYKEITRFKPQELFNLLKE